MVLNSCLTIHMLIHHKSLVNLLFRNRLFTISCSYNAFINILVYILWHTCLSISLDIKRFLEMEFPSQIVHIFKGY